ncbi:MAG: helix-turn-helix domain-containing protein [Chloroflexi bacterium]|nr:helix-turn-helix domain-containing protein [Chloroflexota bacterium]
MTERMAYTVREAATALGVSEWMVREEINQKRIYSIKMGARLLIPRWALEERLGKSPEGEAPTATP